MECKHCHQEIEDNAKFCPYCGKSQRDTFDTRIFLDILKVLKNPFDKTTLHEVVGLSVLFGHCIAVSLAFFGIVQLVFKAFQTLFGFTTMFGTTNPYQQLQPTYGSILLQGIVLTLLSLVYFMVLSLLTHKGLTLKQRFNEVSYVFIFPTLGWLIAWLLSYVQVTFMIVAIATIIIYYVLRIYDMVKDVKYPYLRLLAILIFLAIFTLLKFEAHY